MHPTRRTSSRHYQPVLVLLPLVKLLLQGPLLMVPSKTKVVVKTKVKRRRRRRRTK
jgi:hypothetical protein